MPAPSGNPAPAGRLASRLWEAGLALPPPPTPLGAYVGAAAVGNLLFLSGMLPVAGGKLVIAGRLGEDLTVKRGYEAAQLAALNALAVASRHLGGLERLRRLVKLTVVMATTEAFTEHAAVGDGASDLMVRLFGAEAGHVRVVYGAQSLAIGAPLIVETVFEIET